MLNRSNKPALGLNAVVVLKKIGNSKEKYKHILILSSCSFKFKQKFQFSCDIYNLKINVL